MRRTISCRRAAVAGAVVLLAVLAPGEAAAQPEPTVGMCSDFRVSPDTAEFEPRGGEGSFSVHWTWTSPPTPTDACVYACTPEACVTTVPPYSTATWITHLELEENTLSYRMQPNPGEARP